MMKKEKACIIICRIETAENEIDLFFLFYLFLLRIDFENPDILRFVFVVAAVDLMCIQCTRTYIDDIRYELIHNSIIHIASNLQSHE